MDTKSSSFLRLKRVIEKLNISTVLHQRSNLNTENQDENSLPLQDKAAPSVTIEYDSHPTIMSFTIEAPTMPPGKIVVWVDLKDRKIISAAASDGSQINYNGEGYVDVR